MRRVLIAVAGLAAGLLWACGPSFQAIYEGNVRFERCYALEESPQSSAHERADCWRDWSERYTYGQTRDRIQYAIARYVALSQAANVPTDEALMMAAPGVTPRVTTITAPAPTNAFAPPPKVLDENGGGIHREPPPERNRVLGNPDAGPSAPLPATAPAQAMPPVAPRPPPPLPASECSERCAAVFKDCENACNDDAGANAQTKCAPACNNAYRGCMRGCFK